MNQSDFCNLTVLSYTRGQFGEFFYLILKNKIVPTNLERYKTSSNMFEAYKIDMLFNLLSTSKYQQHWSIEFVKHLTGHSVDQLIINKQYDLLRYVVQGSIDIASSFEHDNFIIDKIGLNKDNFSKLQSIISGDSKSLVITRSHCYYGEQLTNILPNCNHIHFYCSQDKRWIFDLLYFYKKYRNKSYLKNSWNIKTTDQFEQFYNYVINAHNGPIEGATNIDIYDLLANNNIPSILAVDSDTKSRIINNNNENKEIINQLGYDINQSIDINNLYPKFLNWFEETINELGRSY